MALQGSASSSSCVSLSTRLVITVNSTGLKHKGTGTGQYGTGRERDGDWYTKRTRQNGTETNGKGAQWDWYTEADWYIMGLVYRGGLVHNGTGIQRRTGT